MAIQEWRIESPIRRDLRLEHGWLSGRAKLFVDEKLVYERPTTIVDKGFRHEFVVDDIPYVTSVRPSGFGFKYSFGRTESAAPLSDPVRRRQKPSKWVLIVPLSLFAALFFAMGMGVQIPVGKLAGPQPLPVRHLHLAVGIVNLLAIFIAVRKGKRQQSGGNDSVKQQ